MDEAFDDGEAAFAPACNERSVPHLGDRLRGDGNASTDNVLLVSGHECRTRFELSGEDVGVEQNS